MTPSPGSSPAIGVGTWPDWIAAVGSVLAFAAFSIAFIWEVRQRRNDEQRHRRANIDAAADRLDAKMQQARLVFTGISEMHEWGADAYVRNASNADIVDVDLKLVRIRYRWPDQPELQEVKSQRRQSVSAPLAIGPGEKIPVQIEIWNPMRKDGTYEPNTTAVQITFTDARGSRWIRNGNGQPRLA